MTPQELPSLFREGWALAKPQPFLDHFLPLIAAEATFIQPLLADAHGHSEIERMFRQLFVMLADLRVTPRRSAVEGDVVFIESDCQATLGRGPVHFDVCDRFLIKDGLIVSRRSFSDSLPLALQALRRPSSWPRAVRGRWKAVAQ